MKSRDEVVFVSNSTFRNACCMCVLQIGELCKLISSELRGSFPEVPWKEWCGIRDIFAHQYSAVNIPSAWDTIQKDLPNLKKSVADMLDHISNDE